MTTRTKSKTEKKPVLKIILCILLTGVFLYSGYSVLRIVNGYRQAARAKEEFSVFKPFSNQIGESNKIVDEHPQEDTSTSEPVEKITNPSLLEAQAVNGDILGWITIEGTAIDYPFVYSQDNADYLRADLYGNYSVSGTIFMDYRCKKDLSSFNTILYGHKMKDGSMFSDLENFAADRFWSEQTDGMLYLPKATYTLEVFAYAVVQSTDEKLYAPYDDASPESRIGLLQYIRERARQYREVAIGTDDQIIMLSTCNYEYSGARAVLAAKLSKVQ